MTSVAGSAVLAFLLYLRFGPTLPALLMSAGFLPLPFLYVRLKRKKRLYKLEQQLPEAIGMLREVRREPLTGETVSLSGADPLNLAGILTPGAKLPALTGSRLLYRDGFPIAMLASGEVQFFETLDAGSEWALRKALLLSASPGPGGNLPRKHIAAGAA